MADLKKILDYLNAISNDENELFIHLLKLVMLLNTNNFAMNTNTNKTNPTDYFIKNYGVLNLINILNCNLINSRILFLILHIINQVCIDNSSLMDDFISFQLLFYVARLIHLFNDTEIKTEILFMIYKIIFNSSGMLKVFK
jgi:hypothetical protein